jgi:hypothetical protein
MDDEASLRKLKARVSEAQGRVAAALALGRPHEAIEYSRRVEQHVNQLIELDGQNHYHHIVLAATHYNRATILEGLHDPLGALASIRQAVHIYLEYDPSHGDAEAVRDLVRHNPGSRSAIEQLIARAADARARLARMLAAYEGPSAAEAVHHHGAGAVATYRQLLKYGTDYGKADLRRIKRQYDEAKTRLKADW